MLHDRSSPWTPHQPRRQPRRHRRQRRWIRGVRHTREDLLDWSTQDESTVSVSTQVREDSIQLYGFANEDKRKAFQVLLSVSGVGPKVALATLDTFSASALAAAVEGDDIRALNQILASVKKQPNALLSSLRESSKSTSSQTQNHGHRSKYQATPCRSPSRGLATQSRNRSCAARYKNRASP